MTRLTLPSSLALLLATSVGLAPLTACGEGGDGDGDTYDAELLAQYKRALPSRTVLEAPQPGGGSATMAVGDAAEYPQLAAPIVEGINQHIRGIVDTLDAITDTEPTVYNSETLEFVWGPYDNDDSAVADDKVLVYIKDAGESADFRYQYAFLRGIGNDLSTFDPIIWGGASPDPENPDDYGTGVTLYDFEANAAWTAEHDPDVGAIPRGRFATIYMRGPDENAEAKINTIVLASFRDFVTAENPDAAPANFDHLYGHVEDGEQTFDFVSIEADIDITPDNAPDGINELLTIDVAMVNGGIGRGEVTVGGGTLDEDGQNIDMMLGNECWGPLIHRTYFDVTASMDDGSTTSVVTEGAPEDCGPLNASLAELGVPNLDAVPADLRAALANVAENGIPQE